MQVAALNEPGGSLVLSSAELKEVSFAFHLCNLIWGTRAQIFRGGAAAFPHQLGEMQPFARGADNVDEVNRSLIWLRSKSISLVFVAHKSTLIPRIPSIFPFATCNPSTV